MMWGVSKHARFHYEIENVSMFLFAGSIIVKFSITNTDTGTSTALIINSIMGATEAGQLNITSPNGQILTVSIQFYRRYRDLSLYIMLFLEYKPHVLVTQAVMRLEIGRTTADRSYIKL